LYRFVQDIQKNSAVARLTTPRPPPEFFWHIRIYLHESPFMPRSALALTLASRLPKRIARATVLVLATVLLTGSFAALSTADGSLARASAANPGGVDLGSAANYSILGSTSVTNTGNTYIEKELGVWPGKSVTGFPPGVIAANSGAFHSADTSAANARTAAQAAYADLEGRVPDAQYSAGFDIGSSTFGPGVYNFPSSLGITGTVTLDGGGNSGAIFIFQAGTSLITQSFSKVLLINGAQPANVFWQVGSSATLNVGSNFAGTILAHTSITAQTNVSVQGRALALIGAVTLDTVNFGIPPANIVFPTVPSTPTGPSNPANPANPADQSAPGATDTSNNRTEPTDSQLSTLAFEAVGMNPKPMTPGRALLAMTGGSLAGAIWGILAFALGWILFIVGARRRRRQQEKQLEA
jgi:hypothetical protein